VRIRLFFARVDRYRDAGPIILLGGAVGALISSAFGVSAFTGLMAGAGASYLFTSILYALGDGPATYHVRDRGPDSVRPNGQEAAEHEIQLSHHDACSAGY